MIPFQYQENARKYSIELMHGLGYIDHPKRGHADIHKYTFVRMHTYKCRYIFYTTHVDTTVSSIIF